MVLNAPLQCLKKCYESVIELHSFYVLPSSVKKTPKQNKLKTQTHTKKHKQTKKKQTVKNWNPNLEPR